MCGICGVRGLRPAAENGDYLSRMREVLRHRGPDESGAYSSEDILMGIARLQVIDLEGGSQPIYNEDKSLVLVCNGEIYNFPQLRKDLTEKGHSFRTHSDAEVLVHLYEDHGEGCLRYIEGMFAFAIWDKNAKTLFIARDRFGIKPLYYYHKNGRFAFASEAKALFQLPFVSREPDLHALGLYFSLEYVPSPHSAFKDIRKLPPAHHILYKNGNLEIKRYWRLADKAAGNDLPAAEAEAEFLEKFGRAVKDQLTSDVPLGIFLSGGVDSSALAAMAQKVSRREIATFSVGFAENSFDESEYALLVSKRLMTRHHSYIFTLDDLIADFPRVTGYLDEPFADLSIFPAYRLAKFSRDRVKVCLSGEGADELFMGYPTHLAHRYASVADHLPGCLKRGVGGLVNALPVSHGYFSFDFKLKQFMRGISEADPLSRHIAWMGAFSEKEKALLFNREINAFLGDGKNALPGFLSETMREGGRLRRDKQVQYLDIFSYLSEDLLVKLDRASMFSSLEARVPYLDHRLAEFVWGLNSRLIRGKKLLKRAMQSSLPEKILTRRKQGFSLPFSLWLKEGRFQKLVSEYFDQDYVGRQGIFNHGYVSRMLREHLAHKKDHRKKLGAYIMFQAWCAKWLPGRM